MYNVFDLIYFLIFLVIMKKIATIEKNINHKKYIEDLVQNSFEEIQTYIKKASDNFVYGSDNCSEAIATSIAEFEGKNQEIYKGMVSGFGKGIAGNGETCGAMLTGISFISKIAYENGYNKKEIRIFCNNFYKKFQEEFLSTKCSVLSGHDCDQPFDSDFDLHTCGKYIAFTTKEILNFKRNIQPENDLKI